MLIAVLSCKYKARYVRVTERDPFSEGSSIFDLTQYLQRFPPLLELSK
jgi:hypothetical protein